MKKVKVFWLYKAICGRILSDRYNPKRSVEVMFMPVFKKNAIHHIMKVRNGTLRSVLKKDWDTFALTKYRDEGWQERLDEYVDIWYENGVVTDFDTVNSYADIEEMLEIDFSLKGKDEVIILNKDEYDLLTDFGSEPDPVEYPTSNPHQEEKAWIGDSLDFDNEYIAPGEDPAVPLDPEAVSAE